MPKPTKPKPIPRINLDRSITRTIAPDIEGDGKPFMGFLGRVENISYKRIVRLFGLPTTNGDEDKTDAAWIIETPDGYGELYNYKNGRTYLGPEGQKTVDITDWCIRGENRRVHGWIELSLY
jgi:hypothetical protein